LRPSWRASARASTAGICSRRPGSSSSWILPDPGASVSTPGNRKSTSSKFSPHSLYWSSSRPLAFGTSGERAGQPTARRSIPSGRGVGQSGWRFHACLLPDRNSQPARLQRADRRGIGPLVHVLHPVLRHEDHPLDGQDGDARSNPDRQRAVRSAARRRGMTVSRRPLVKGCGPPSCALAPRHRNRTKQGRGSALSTAREPDTRKDCGVRQGVVRFLRASRCEAARESRRNKNGESSAFQRSVA